jgi:hypothetical protein
MPGAGSSRRLQKQWLTSGVNVWTAKNIVSIDITRAEIRCNVCHQSEKWTNPFVLTRRDSLNPKSKAKVLIKDAKKLITWFTQHHLNQHENKLETS